MYIVSLNFVVITVKKKHHYSNQIMALTMIITSQMLTDNFGKNVKYLRENIKISQEKLAEKIDVSKNTISNIENGKRFVSAETLAKLANALNTDVYELFKPEDTIPDNSEGVIYKYEEEVKQAMDKITGKYISKIKRSKKPKGT